eukprot:7153628-Pyramimonas_sp.AAC.1
MAMCRRKGPTGFGGKQCANNITNATTKTNRTASTSAKHPGTTAPIQSRRNTEFLRTSGRSTSCHEARWRIKEERPDYVSGVRSTRKLDVVGQQKADSYLRNMLRDIADKNNTVDSCRLDALLTFATTVSACWPDNSDIVASRQKLQVLQRELKSSTMKASMVSAAELCEASPGDTDNYEEMHRLVCDAAGAQLAPEEAAGIVGSMAACLRYLC